MGYKQVMKTRDFKRCVEFHGHFCPGLAIGFRAAKVALEKLGCGRSVDEEMVSVVLNDACGVDAVQALTGCTFGKGNLIHRDHGKQVFYFFTRKTPKALRIALKETVFMPTSEQIDLIRKVRESGPSEKDKRAFKAMQLKKARGLLEAPAGELFEITRSAIPVPPKARVTGSLPCDLCGEAVMITKLHKVKNSKICGECLEKSKNN